MASYEEIQSLFDEYQSMETEPYTQPEQPAEYEQESGPLGGYLKALESNRYTLREAQEDEEPGTLGMIGRSVAKGGVDFAEMGLRFARSAGSALTPGSSSGGYGEAPGEEGLATRGLKAIEKYREETPYLQDTEASQGAVPEGVRSSVPSLGIAGIGSAIGVGAATLTSGPFLPLVLAGIGATSLATWAFSDYDKSLEEQRTVLGKTREEAEPAALVTSLVNASLEAATDITLGWMIGGKIVSQPGKQALKRTVLQLLKTSPKEVLKRGGAVMAAEVGFESLASGITENIRKKAGFEDAMSFGEAVASTIGPAAVASGIFLGIGGPIRLRNKSKIKSALSNSDVDAETRLNAVREVSSAIAEDDKTLATEWNNYATQAVEMGEAIDLETELGSSKDLLRSLKTTKTEETGTESEREERKISEIQKAATGDGAGVRAKTSPEDIIDRATEKANQVVSGMGLRGVGPGVEAQTVSPMEEAAPPIEVSSAPAPAPAMNLRPAFDVLQAEQAERDIQEVPDENIPATVAAPVVPTIEKKEVSHEALGLRSGSPLRTEPDLLQQQRELNRQPAETPYGRSRAARTKKQLLKMRPEKELYANKIEAERRIKEAQRRNIKIHPDTMEGLEADIKTYDDFQSAKPKPKPSRLNRPLPEGLVKKGQWYDPAFQKNVLQEKLNRKITEEESVASEDAIIEAVNSQQKEYAKQRKKAGAARMEKIATALKSGDATKAWEQITTEEGTALQKKIDAGLYRATGIKGAYRAFAKMVEQDDAALRVEKRKESIPKEIKDKKPVENKKEKKVVTKKEKALNDYNEYIKSLNEDDTKKAGSLIEASPKYPSGQVLKIKNKLKVEKETESKKVTPEIKKKTKKVSKAISKTPTKVKHFIQQFGYMQLPEKSKRSQSIDDFDELPFESKLMFRKNGTYHMDTATEELRREGWLGEDEELNFLLREGKAFLNRGNLLDDRSHLEKDRHKTKETRRLEKEMEDDAWVKANVVAGEYFDIKAGGLFAEKHFGKMLDGKVEEIGYFGKFKILETLDFPFEVKIETEHAVYGQKIYDIHPGGIMSILTSSVEPPKEARTYSFDPLAGEDVTTKKGQTVEEPMGALDKPKRRQLQLKFKPKDVKKNKDIDTAATEVTKALDKENVVTDKNLVAFVTSDVKGTGDIKWKSLYIKDADDAASLLAATGLHEKAQEELFLVMTDSKNKILEVFFYSKGTASSLDAHPLDLAGRVFNTPGAKKVYLVHNHPSGSLEASNADISVSNSMAALLDGRGVSFESSILANNKHFSFNPKLTSPVDIKMEGAGKSIDIKERFLSIGERRSGIRNTADMKEFVKNDLNGESGFIFFNNRMEPVGIYKWPVGEKAINALSGLIAAREKVNATMIAINIKGDRAYKNRFSFLYNFFSIINDRFRIVDIIENGVSYADTGIVSQGDGRVLFGKMFAKLATDEKAAISNIKKMGILFSKKNIPSGKYITEKDVQQIFEKQKVGTSKDGSIWVKTKGGDGVLIKTVDFVTEKNGTVNIEYGKIADNGEMIAGAYQSSEIQIVKGIGDKWTLAHEAEHWAEDMGMINKVEQGVLKKHIKKLAEKNKFELSDNGGKEDRARFVEQSLKTRELSRNKVIDRMLQKIFDYVDGIINLVKRTQRGIIKDFESGKIFEREGAQAAEEGRAKYEKTAQRWYSKMEKILSEKLPKSTTVSNLKDMINNMAYPTKGRQTAIKAEELEWSGLMGWLDTQEGKVTKQEVLDYLDQNRVVIEEVVKGDQDLITTEESRELHNLEVMENRGENLTVDQKINLGILKAKLRRAEKGKETKFSQYQLPGGKNYKELILALPTTVSSKEYRSGHFKEPNILAHIRFNEREVDGKKVLFIEEIQSDWHQEGRKKGYNAIGYGIVVHDYMSSKLSDTKEEAEKYIAKLIADSKKSRYEKDMVRSDYEIVREPMSVFGRVPDAPFKGSKNWSTLAMKRMVRYAAENGFDKVAWTTGEMQADRYDLSKHIDSVSWEIKDGTKHVYFTKKGEQRKSLIGPIGNDGKISMGPYKGRGVEDVLGKEIAEKVSATDKAELSGLDLKVGGEGMKGFYDKIIPSATNKFFNKIKWGKAKVDTTKIDFGGKTEIVMALPITEEMRSKALREGMPLFQTKKTSDIQFSTFKSDDIETEKRIQASKKALGEDPRTFMEKMKDRLDVVMHGFTRQFLDLDENDQANARAIEWFQRLRDYPSAAKETAVRSIDKITKKLSPDEFSMFERKVLHDDLKHEVDQDHALPFGYTVKSLESDAKRLDSMIENSSNIKKALQDRKETMDDLSGKLVGAGILTEEQLKNPSYFRHMVIQYAVEQKYAQGSGKKIKKPKPGYAKGRAGSLQDINANYLEAEFEFMHRALIDLKTADTLKKIEKSDYNIIDKLKQQAKDENDNLLIKAGIDIEGITEKEKKDALGKYYKKWQDVIPEGYRAWQADKGLAYYVGNSLTDRAMNLVMESLSDPEFSEISTDILEEISDGIRQQLMVAGKKPFMVLPDGVASTLDNLRPPDQRDMVNAIFKKPLGAWKQWVLMNPRRVFKYNLNNLSGDLDAVIAGNPKVLNKAVEAFKELAAVYKGGEPTQRYKDAVEMGVMQSGLTMQEIPEINDIENFQRLQSKIRGEKGIKVALRKAWTTSKGLTQFRENILRYAAYISYLERLNSGETVESIGYGAAKPSMVDGQETSMDKAAILARGLVGDYGAVSHYGRGIREKLIPFYSWMEVNTGRYNRLISNAYKQGIKEGLSATGTIGVMKGARISAYLALRMGMFYMAVGLFNNLFHGDEEDDLDALSQKQLHLTLGSDDDGNIYTLRMQGALSDYLAWIGFSDVLSAAKEVEQGRGTYTDALSNVAKAPINKVVNGLTPLLKAPLEWAMERSIYPDVFNSRKVTDSNRNLARLMSAENEYDWLTGKPSRGYAESWMNSVAYRKNIGEIAYYDIKQKVRNWNKARGREFDGFFTSKRSEALRNYKISKRYGDKKSEKKYLKELQDLKIYGKDLVKSIQKSSPLGALSKKDRIEFMQTLSAKDKKLFEKAKKWYYNTYYK